MHPQLPTEDTPIHPQLPTATDIVTMPSSEGRTDRPLQTFTGNQLHSLSTGEISLDESKA